jgi:hypothetical protein
VHPSNAHGRATLLLLKEVLFFPNGALFLQAIEIAFIFWGCFDFFGFINIDLEIK